MLKMVQLHLKQFFKTSAGILSRPVLFDTFKFCSITTTFLEDVFVDFVVVGRMPRSFVGLLDFNLR